MRQRRRQPRLVAVRRRGEGVEADPGGGAVQADWRWHRGGAAVDDRARRRRRRRSTIGRGGGGGRGGLRSEEGVKEEELQSTRLYTPSHLVPGEKNQPVPLRRLRHRLVNHPVP